MRGRLARVGEARVGEERVGEERVGEEIWRTIFLEASLAVFFLEASLAVFLRPLVFGGGFDFLAVKVAFGLRARAPFFAELFFLGALVAFCFGRGCTGAISGTDSSSSSITHAGASSSDSITGGRAGGGTGGEGTGFGAIDISMELTDAAVVETVTSAGDGRNMPSCLRPCNSSRVKWTPSVALLWSFLCISARVLSDTTESAVGVDSESAVEPEPTVEPTVDTAVFAFAFPLRVLSVGGLGRYFG